MPRRPRFSAATAIFLGGLLFILSVVCSIAAGEVIPRRPDHYFNDYALLVSPKTAEALNSRLAAFERSNAIQCIVVIYPKMQSESAISDYAVRVAKEWKVGLKGKNSGVVLFVFVEERKMFIATGYGLEAVLPDALAKRIVEDEIKPRFRENKFDEGMEAGVNAIIRSARGEYAGTGRTVGDRRGGHRSNWVPFAIFGFFMLMMIVSSRRRRGTVYGGRGRSGWGDVFLPMIGGFGGGSWGGGGGFSGGSDSFSAGGGDFGGGGAGGDW